MKRRDNKLGVELPLIAETFLPPDAEKLPIILNWDVPRNFNTELVSFDIESNPKTGEVYMIGFFDGTKMCIVDEEKLMRSVTNWFHFREYSGQLNIGFNSIHFDAPMLHKQFKMSRKPFDTDDLMLLCWLANNQLHRYSLESCCEHFLPDLPKWKNTVTWDWEAYSDLINVAPVIREAAHQYNARDCINTYKLYLRVKSLLDDRDWWLYHHYLKPAAIGFTHFKGVPVDRDKLVDAITEVAETLKQTNNEILKIADEHGLPRFNAGSPKQVGQLLYEKMKLHPPKYTVGGTPSTDASSLNELAIRSDKKVIHLMLKRRDKDTLLNKFLLPYASIVDEHGFVFPSFIVAGPETMRTACRAPNIQNWPRDLKYIITAHPGKKLINVDMSQGEFRTMAFLSREPTMMKVYTENLHGGDMHNFMANEIAKKRGKDSWDKEDRQNAKPINFGCMYGAEWYTLQQTALNDYGVKFSEKEAKFFRDEVFFKTFPLLPVYFRKILRELKITKGVRGPLGNFRKLPDIDHYDESRRAAAFREAINTPNQGLSSAIALTATFLVTQQHPWIEIISFNHDATMAHVSEDRAEEAGNLIKRSFENEAIPYLNQHFQLNFDIPIKADITIGDNWK